MVCKVSCGRAKEIEDFQGVLREEAYVRFNQFSDIIGVTSISSKSVSEDDLLEDDEAEFLEDDFFNDDEDDFSDEDWDDILNDEEGLFGDYYNDYDDYDEDYDDDL